MDRFNEMLLFAESHGCKSVVSAFSKFGKARFLEMFKKKETPQDLLYNCRLKISRQNIERFSPDRQIKELTKIIRRLR